MATVNHILATKGGESVSVTPGTPVSDVAELLARLNIGAVLVLDGGRLAGILSERDIVRHVARDGASALDKLAEDLMTRDVKTAGRATSLAEAMETMANGHFRHMPVLEDGAVVGVISQGDVVKARIAHHEWEMDQMKGYVGAGHPIG